MDEGEAELVLVALPPPPELPPPPPPPPPRGAPAELARLDDVVDIDCCEAVEVASEVDVDEDLEEVRVERVNDLLGLLEDDMEAFEDSECEEDCVVVIVGAWVDFDSVVPKRVVVNVVSSSVARNQDQYAA